MSFFLDFYEPSPDYEDEDSPSPKGMQALR